MKRDTKAKKEMRAICKNPKKSLLDQYLWALKVFAGGIEHDKYDLRAAERILDDVAKVISHNKKNFPERRDDTSLDIEMSIFSISKLTELLTCVEYGFRQHEKGKNLQLTIEEATKIICGKPEQTKSEHHIGTKKHHDEKPGEFFHD